MVVKAYLCNSSCLMLCSFFFFSLCLLLQWGEPDAWKWESLSIAGSFTYKCSLSPFMSTSLLNWALAGSDCSWVSFISKRMQIWCLLKGRQVSRANATSPTVAKGQLILAKVTDGEKGDWKYNSGIVSDFHLLSRVVLCTGLRTFKTFFFLH